MFDVFRYAFMRRAVLASVLGGASCGIVGGGGIMLGIPFVGVAMAHAAFAGALFGLLVGIDPVLSGFIFCLLSASFIGPVADRGDFEPNLSTGIIFSIVLGLAFLFMGMIEGPQANAMRYIWGSILTVSAADTVYLLVTAVLIFLFLALFYKEILAVLYDRTTARAAGVADKAVFYLILFLCGAAVTVNLNTVGGILIFSLIISPPAAAYQLTYSFKMMHLLSAVFGVASCLAGLFFSYVFDLRSGAAIIITSGLIFVISLALSPKRRNRVYAGS